MQVLTGLLLLLALALQANTTPIKAAISIEEKLGADNNVFRLSDPDLDRLDADPAFQVRAAGAEDVRMDHRVLADLRWNLPGKRTGRLKVSTDIKFVDFVDNASKNYHTTRFGLDWQRKAGWGVDLSWFALRNFFLRDYQDGDTGQNYGAEFDGDEFRLRLRARGPSLGVISKPTLYLHAISRTAYYNGWFSEYDSESIEFGARLVMDFPFGLGATAGYSFVDTENVGFSEQGLSTAGEDSEYGDSGNQEDQMRLSVDWAGKAFGENLSMALAFVWRHREFQTQLPVLEDPIHSGRTDDRYTLTLSKTWKINKKLSLRPYLEREWRKVSGPYVRLPVLKDFDSRRIGVALRWRIL